MAKPRNDRGYEMPRLDLRFWDSDERALIDQAAEISGDKYTTEWARRVLIVEARRVVASNKKRR